MASLWTSSSSPFPFPQFQNPHEISKTSIAITSSTSISASPNLRFPSLQPIFCGTNSISSADHHEFPSTKIFVKGLPKSTSEGRLKKAFSQFGEVSRVKIMTERKSRESLGFAYVWFCSEESAQLAVKEKNGEVHICHNCEAWIQKSDEGNTIQVLISTSSSTSFCESLDAPKS